MLGDDVPSKRRLQAAWNEYDDKDAEEVLAKLPKTDENLAKLQAGGLWHTVHGDRRQELVIIGEKGKMNRTAMEQALDAALCTDEEISQVASRKRPRSS